MLYIRTFRSYRCYVNDPILHDLFLVWLIGYHILNSPENKIVDDN